MYSTYLPNTDQSVVVTIRSGDILRLRDRYRGDPLFSFPLSLSGEILRVRDRYDNAGDRERLRDRYREPASDVTLPERLLFGLRSGLMLRVLLEPLLPLRLLSRSSSSLPSIASRSRLFRGPISPVSSRTSLLVIRGRMMSQTRSSLRSSSTNSSMYVRLKPPRGNN